ncbi:hypothetical protein CYMTET_27182 [Cymbomonas tetramitiformis]|uniref:MI domain-containing protein n=1 Tax=Cymbomonas tetramitiformis TaxID=36881 RepID=A0AAE0FRT1_9CHLO|nr:hypothetical protein CYMTET_27182 [Cymbomonas tetramitiformis]
MKPRKNRGPDLPFALKKQFEEDIGKKGGKKQVLLAVSRKDKRKQQRTEQKQKKAQNFAWRHAQAKDDRLASAPGGKTKPFGPEPAKAAQPPQQSKDQRTEPKRKSAEITPKLQKHAENPPKKGKKPKTRFAELLPGSTSGRKSIEEEDQEMRQLYKRLKGRVKASPPSCALPLGASRCCVHSWGHRAHSPRHALLAGDVAGMPQAPGHALLAGDVAGMLPPPHALLAGPPPGMPSWQVMRLGCLCGAQGPSDFLDDLVPDLTDAPEKAKGKLKGTRSEAAALGSEDDSDGDFAMMGADDDDSESDEEDDLGLLDDMDSMDEEGVFGESDGGEDEEEGLGASGEEEGDDGDESGDEDDLVEDDAEIEEAAPAVKRQAAMQEETAKAPAASASRYVPPHLRKPAASKDSALTRNLRGLMNRMSEANVASISAEVSALPDDHGRRSVTDAIGEELLRVCVEGPRMSELNATVFATFMSGCAATMGAEVGAHLCAEAAIALERSIASQNSQACANLGQVLARLCLCGLLPSACIYGMLQWLHQDLEELQVSITLNVLRVVGVKVRKEDPEGMKRFVESLQERVAAAKAAQSAAEPAAGAEAGQLTTRARLLLELVVDLKNNKFKGTSLGISPGLAKWLSQIGVGDLAVAYAGLSWGKLVDKGKVGMWWTPVAGEALPGGSTVGGFFQVAQKKGQAGGGELLKLAGQQRMNTEVRRAIFCVIMGADDFLDAFDRLVRLPLADKQDREIIRVLLECCLQEKVYNPYYMHLLNRLCTHDHNHKFTVQYAAWDHFKQLDDMEVRRLTNLARLLAGLVLEFSLSLAVLKVVDFSRLSSKQIFFYRIFFEQILLADEELLTRVLQRIASAGNLAPLRDGIQLFLQTAVKLPKGGKQADLRARIQLAQQVLRSATIT